MFEVSSGDAFGAGEPYPDEVLLAEAWDEPDVPVGMTQLLADPDDLVWEAVGRPLGADSLGLLMAVDPHRLSEQGRSVALRRLEEFSACVDAAKVKMTAAIAGPAPADDTALRDDFSSSEVGVASRCNVHVAGDKVRFARDIEGRLRLTAAAMAEGRITLAQAKCLSESLAHLDDELAREIEGKLLAFSHRQDLTAFKASVRRWRSKLDPTWTPRAKKAREDAEVRHWADDDGSGTLEIRGPLEITAAIAKALDAYSESTKSELGGTAAQRKVVGLRDMVEGYLDSPGAPRQHGRLPIVNVTIDLATLLQLRKGIAEIVGVGAIPSDVAHWLLADGAPLRRLVIDPLNGQLLDLGTDGYVVPPWLAEHLIAKYPTSAAPHSSVPSAGCDMEHNIPHDHGGRTNVINVTPIDRRWHRAKTHADWTYTKDFATGVITWTSPISGLTCEVHPYDYRAGP